MRTMTIKIPNVSESLEAKLEAFILGGTFWPDQPLAAERRLAAEFDVSRTSLRNALASLRDKGLLTQLKKGYHVTNVLADLLQPGLAKISGRDPKWLLDYWLLFLEDVIALADRKAQNSDRVQVQKSALTLKTCVEDQDAASATAAFDSLFRSLINACYNFFLGQTHYAWFNVASPHVADAMAQLCTEPKNAELALDAIEKVGAFSFNSNGFRDILAPGFKAKNAGCEVVVPGGTDPKQLIDVILRHPVAIEEVYELRLISEKHAAAQAAGNATVEQVRALSAHLEKMTRVVDRSPADYSALDTKLHHMITECTQNPVFSVLDAALAPVFSRTTKQWLQKHLEIRHEQSTTHLQHTQIVDAIVAGDAEAAQTAMVEHFSYVIRSLRSLREQDHLHEIATARRLLG